MTSAADVMAFHDLPDETKDFLRKLAADDMLYEVLGVDPPEPGECEECERRSFDDEMKDEGGYDEDQMVAAYKEGYLRCSRGESLPNDIVIAGEIDDL